MRRWQLGAVAAIALSIGASVHAQFPVVSVPVAQPGYGGYGYGYDYSLEMRVANLEMQLAALRMQAMYPQQAFVVAQPGPMAGMNTLVSGAVPSGQQGTSEGNAAAIQPQVPRFPNLFGLRPGFNPQGSGGAAPASSALEEKLDKILEKLDQLTASANSSELSAP